MAGCGSEAVAPVAAGAVHTRAAAEQVADLVLHRVKLPPSSEGNRTAPSPALGNPPQRPATPDLAEATDFANASGTVAGTVAFFERHRPAGYTASGSGQGSSNTGTGQVATVMDALGDMPPGVASAQLLLSATQVSAQRVGIRVDAQVTWLPPKPAGLTVPARDTTAVVSITETASPSQVASEHLPAPRRIVVSAPSQVERLRDAADGLVPAVPGVRSCPADLGTGYVVAFATLPTAAPDMTFAAGSCGFVQVTGRGGQHLGTLANDGMFTDTYDRMLGSGG
jgi:hypothetical protein